MLQSNFILALHSTAMKLKICFVVVGSVLSSILFAQQGPLPTVTAFRNGMLQLIESSKHRFNNIDAGATDVSSPEYRTASFHLVQNTRNQLFLNTDSARDSYNEYIREGITAEQVNTDFNNLLTIFGKAIPELKFLSKREETYGNTYYYYNAQKSLICQLEGYFNPQKKTWSISVGLRHPTKGDLENIEKAIHPEGDIIAKQKAITETLTALLKDRVNKFKSFQGLDMSGKDGSKLYGVKETSYGFTPGPVEFIDEDAAGATIYHLAASGFQIPVEIAVCYSNLISPELEKEGYTISKNDATLNLIYTISYKDFPVSVCKLEKDKGVVSIVILSN